jgi:formiminotetrahydrofolate cyclodeaminase
MDRDTEAFNEVAAVFTMPKATDAEKAARTASLQTALKHCVATPAEMMRLALDALELAASVQGKTNSAAASDFGVAALSLKAAVRGAWLNVLINIRDIKDEDFAAKAKAECRAILEKSEKIADEIYGKVLAELSG